MKKSLRIICSLLLFSFLTFGMSFETRAALPASGNLGPNGSESSVTYTLVNGILTITGTGPTKDYYYTGSPFFNSTEIKKVKIENGVATIGSALFLECSELSTVEMADSVRSIGDYAFFNCTKLASVTLSEELTTIGDCAFTECSSAGVTIPAKVNSIGTCAFRAVSGSFTVAAGNTHYKAVDGVLFDYAGTTLIQYPAGGRKGL